LAKKIFFPQKYDEIRRLDGIYSFTHHRLPLSFERMWIPNRDRFPERELRNADQLYILPHNYATLKLCRWFRFAQLAKGKKSRP
jgi:hypothetical protein